MPTGPGASRAFAISTAICKKKGFTDFKAGSPGANCRGQHAEQVAASHPKGRGYGRRKKGY